MTLYRSLDLPKEIIVGDKFNLCCRGPKHNEDRREGGGGGEAEGVRGGVPLPTMFFQNPQADELGVSAKMFSS